MTERTQAAVPATRMAGEQLPASTFEALDGGNAGRLRGGRSPRVVFTPHARECAVCAAYLDTLAEAVAGVGEWGGQVVVLLPGDAEARYGSAGEGVRLLVDAARELASGEAALFVADEWGEVYFVSDASREHDLPDAGELVEWVRFIAIQCPECEAPEGLWRTL